VNIRTSPVLLQDRRTVRPAQLTTSFVPSRCRLLAHSFRSASGWELPLRVGSCRASIDHECLLKLRARLKPAAPLFVGPTRIRRLHKSPYPNRDGRFAPLLVVRYVRSVASRPPFDLPYPIAAGDRHALVNQNATSEGDDFSGNTSNWVIVVRNLEVATEFNKL